MRALLLPLDDRPVTYIFPQLIARVAGLEVTCPPRHLLGSLKAAPSTEVLSAWFDQQVMGQKPYDGLLLCLDSLLHGGLINSRRSTDTFYQISQRANHLKHWKANGKLYAQASIMRISDNYDNIEEKEYWSRYGREIFAWSEQMHRLAEHANPPELAKLETRIPANIKQDYLQTRFRNFQVNKLMLELAQQGLIDFLVYSLDDSGEYGLNVLESERLLEQAKRLSLKQKVICYAGADEVLCALIARFLIEKSALKKPIAKVIFSNPQTAYCPSRFEGQAIGETVRSQLEAIGIENSDERPAIEPLSYDFAIIIHGNQGVQGDHVWLPGHEDHRSLDTTDSVKETIEALVEEDKPVILCDVAYANGSDPLLIAQLLNQPQLLNKLWSYAGWNTTGNTVGSSVSLGVCKWYYERSAAAPNTNTINSDLLKECLFIRLADDWAYQTQVRPQLQGPASPAQLQTLMQPFLDRIATALNYKPRSVHTSQPWQRTFEIEIDTALRV